MIGSSVASLDRLEDLVPMLQELAVRHAGYQVLPEHFPIVGEALLWTLRTGMGFKWTPQIKEAWEAVWRQMVSVMEPALINANIESSASGSEARHDGPSNFSRESSFGRLVSAESNAPYSPGRFSPGGWKNMEEDEYFR